MCGAGAVTAQALCGRELCSTGGIWTVWHPAGYQVATYKWEALVMDVLCHPSRQQVKYVHIYIINIADCHQIEVQPWWWRQNELWTVLLPMSGSALCVCACSWWLHPSPRPAGGNRLLELPGWQRQGQRCCLPPASLLQWWWHQGKNTVRNFLYSSVKRLLPCDRMW